MEVRSMSRSALLFKPALAIVFLTFCVCKPGIGAAGNAREAASRPLVSRAEMYNRFKVGRWVENKRIRGKDLVALMVGTPVDIRIRNAMIEGGLDFRGVGAPACKSIRIIDANQAHYYLKRAALKEARRKQGWMRRWPLELEWAGWGLLSGYGTRLS